MDENANPNPDPVYYLPAYVPLYYPPACYPPAYCPPIYVLPYTDPAYYPVTYVPYALYAAAPVVATHYSPVGSNYAAVMPPFLGANPSTASEAPTPADAELPTPAETELPTPTPAAEVEIPRQYLSERLLSKELRFIGKIVYIDLQKNRKGLFFQMKDLSKSRSNYILLDLSGLDEFLTHLNHFMETNTNHFLETNKCTEFLFDTRTMRHNKKTYTFTTLLEEKCLILRIRMVEGKYDHSIAIPVEWSSDHGCAGWSEFGNKLLNLLQEHLASPLDTNHLASTMERQQELMSRPNHLASTMERQQELMSRLQRLLDHPGSSSH